MTPRSVRWALRGGLMRASGPICCEEGRADQRGGSARVFMVCKRTDGCNCERWARSSDLGTMGVGSAPHALARLQDVPAPRWQGDLPRRRIRRGSGLGAMGRREPNRRGKKQPSGDTRRARMRGMSSKRGSARHRRRRVPLSSRSAIHDGGMNTLAIVRNRRHVQGPTGSDPVTSDLRGSPGKQRTLAPGVEPQQGRGQDERTATPDEEVPVLEQQPKESVEEKDS